MLFSKQISALQASVATLEGKLSAATGNVEALTGEKAELERQLTEANAKLEGAVTAEAHQAAISAKDLEITGFKGQIQKLEQSVDTKVVEGIAKTGFAAIRRDPAAVESPAKNDGKRVGSPAQRLAAGIKIDTGKSK